MITRLLVLIVGLAFLFLPFPVSLSQEKDGKPPAKCPGPNSTKHNDGLYDFSYESWVRPATNGFVLGRCVHTNNTKVVYIDWKKTNVLGYATPELAISSTIPSPSDDVELVDTDLWYGAAPKKINGPYRETKKDKQASETHGMSLRSTIQMSVPDEPGKIVADGENVAVTPISVEFNVQVTKLANGKYIYVYSWVDKLAKDRKKPVLLEWDSPSLTKALKESGALEKDKTRYLELAEERRGGYFLDEGSPAYEVVSVQFLRPNSDKLAGSAPVAIFKPVK